jgi:ElaB/YqjD/DUF883 family membrane-anchored ribosome-binding protein
VTEKISEEDGLMSSDKPRTGFSGSPGDAGNEESIVVEAPSRLGDDVSGLRAEISKMHDTLSKFVSEAGGPAARAVRNAGEALASHVGSTASGLATTSAEMASSETGQIKTFATELERVARKNPLGALAGALTLGIVIGLIMRGRG